MPKRKEPELDPAEQYRRFEETGKKVGVTESEEEFARAFAKLTKKKPRPRRKTR